MEHPKQVRGKARQWAGAQTGHQLLFSGKAKGRREIGIHAGLESGALSWGQESVEPLSRLAVSSKLPFAVAAFAHNMPSIRIALALPLLL